MISLISVRDLKFLERRKKMNDVVLTEQQEELVNRIIDWFWNSKEPISSYTGEAGCGKTVVMSEVIRRLGLHEWEVAPMCYTGTAALVLRSKGLTNSRTIHSWIFKPVFVRDNEQYDAYLNRYKTKLIFVDKQLPPDVKLICIDEASFVPMSLKQKLLDKGVKILCCGDLNQLPPVGDNPAFLIEKDIFKLTQIMRQDKDSGIVQIAHKILNGEELYPGTYDNVDIIEQEDLTDDMLMNADMILCGKNVTRDKYNTKMRRLRGIDPKRKIPEHGEKVICRKNNWRYDLDGISLANGLTGTVVNYPTVASISKDRSWFKINFKPFAFNRTFIDLKCSFEYFNASKEKKDVLRNSKYTRGERFELAYCITTHLSQGSQYNDGIYISEWLGGDIMKHLDYTGITRFAKHCTFVLRSRKQYW